MSLARRPRRLAALPLALAGLSACASGGAARGPVLLPSGWAPPAGQRCEIQDAPRQLPAVDQVVDSAALAGELRGAPAGTVGLFTIRYDTLGVADTVRLAGADPARGAGEDWLRAVANRVRQRSPFPVPTRRGQPKGWSVLLRIEGGSSPALRLGRTEECPPVLTNQFAVTSYLQQSFSEFLRSNPVHRRPSAVTMRIWVDSTGVVREAAPHRSNAVGPVEEIARRAALQARFQPARLNRRPVGAWVLLPLDFTVRTQSRRRGS